MATVGAAIKDGEPWIVYQWVTDDGDGLFVVRPDGTDGRRILADLPARLSHPDWSPDGKLIAFERSIDDDVREIWTASADGSDAKKLIGCEAAPCVFVDRPAWSPDGKRLAYVRFDYAAGSGPSGGRASIEVFDRANGVRRVIARPPAVGAEYSEYIYPRWSPDGKQVVFEVTHEPVPPTGPVLGSSIAVVKADGSEVDAARTLTDAKLFGAYPDWSPDGKRIVLSTHELGYFQDTTEAVNLYTIRPDGTGLTQITHFGKNDTRATQPSWTSDGSRIIFCSVKRTADDTQGFGLRQIAFIDADGLNMIVMQEQLATHPRLRPTP